MGDRITRFYPCKQPNCKGEVEEYDASSSLLFVADCDTCHWRDPRSYWEIDTTHIVLCTEEEARKNGGLKTCQKCGQEKMGSWVSGDSCIDCDNPK